MTETSYDEQKIIQQNMKAVAQYFKQNNIRFTFYDDNTLMFSFGGFENLPQLQLALIFDAKPSMQCRTAGFAQAGEEKIPGIFEVVNELNSRYRFIKVYVDVDDGEIICESDINIDTETAGFSAHEVMARMHYICDDIYPIIMTKLWANQN